MPGQICKEEAPLSNPEPYFVSQRKPSSAKIGSENSFNYWECFKLEVLLPGQKKRNALGLWARKKTSEHLNKSMNCIRATPWCYQSLEHSAPDWLSLTWSLVCKHSQSFNRIWLFMTPWTVAHQVPLSMGFPRQGYWSGLSFPAPEDLPDPGIELASLASPALAGGFFATVPFGKPQSLVSVQSSSTSCLLIIKNHLSLSCQTWLFFSCG